MIDKILGKLHVKSYLCLENIWTGVSPIGKWSRLVLDFLFLWEYSKSLQMTIFFVNFPFQDIISRVRPVRFNYIPGNRICY